jgi:outer membrane receptor protein involved in Fe transport
MKKSNRREPSPTPALRARTPLASAIVATLSAALAQSAYAQQASDTGQLEDVVVTAQKRSESLQDVPVSIIALGTEKLEQMNVGNFDDYAKLLPSLAYSGAGPGFAIPYMRGVASGANGNHSGPLPSVGVYLDEQPITTIQGALDIRVYDIARVEALAGPQGTLYGASSQSGTLRIITNKPDPTAFAAGYDLGVDTVRGELGYTGEGYVNIPLSPNTTVRLVGWYDHDAGYIDNVRGTRTYPGPPDQPTSSGACIANFLPAPAGCSARGNFAKDRYNEVDTYGARAALKIDLNDEWTVTPTLMGQQQNADGSFLYDPGVGDLKIQHYFPEYSKDRWGQAALTVEGKVANLDVVYAGAFLKRRVESAADYTDYSFFYDTLFNYGQYYVDDAGNVIDPSQYTQSLSRYTKQSHEIRVSTPAENRWRLVAGVFGQHQTHQIQERYRIDGIGAQIEVPGWEDTIWLTRQKRVDRDYAIFGEFAFDFTDKLTGTAGIRFFEADNTLKGFFGYGAGFSGSTGEAACFAPGPFKGAPCVNLDKKTVENGNTPKVNLTYKFDADRMVYVTYSEGFRPGGINRRGTLTPYGADYLKNYEVGWKTTWGGAFRFNGAVFVADWDNFQYSFLGANGLTEIQNAAAARIKGVEADFSWAATAGLTLSGGVAFYDTELKDPYCGVLDANGSPITDCADPLAPAGARLPITPKFKGNVTARYEWSIGELDAHLQGTYAYTGKVLTDLRTEERSILGEQDSYGVLDLTAGVRKGPYQFELYVKNATDERADMDRGSQCAVSTCGAQYYILTNVPRNFGVRFAQKF